MNKQYLIIDRNGHNEGIEGFLDYDADFGAFYNEKGRDILAIRHPKIKFQCGIFIITGFISAKEKQLYEMKTFTIFNFLNEDCFTAVKE